VILKTHKRVSSSVSPGSISGKYLLVFYTVLKGIYSFRFIQFEDSVLLFVAVATDFSEVLPWSLPIFSPSILLVSDLAGHGYY